MANRDAAPSSSVITRTSFTLGDFELLRSLGDGSYSEVIEVFLKSTGAKYALKIVDKYLIVKHKQVEAVKQERSLLAGLSHPGIVHLDFTFQDQSSLYFGLECCPNGELFDQIQVEKRLSIQHARFYAAEIVEILAYLRSQKIVHRDLKPENLLLDERGHLKLGDFGSAKVVQPDDVTLQGTELVGTADYSPPEALKGQKLGYGADTWALGCIIFQMLVGEPPFRGGTEYLTFQRIQSLDLCLPDNLDTDAADLIKSLLQELPENRLGAGEEDYSRLKTLPFFSGIEWKALWDQDAPPFSPVLKNLDVEEDPSWMMKSLVLGNPQALN